MRGIYVVFTRFSIFEQARMNALEALFSKYNIHIDGKDDGGSDTGFRAQYCIFATENELFNVRDETQDILGYYIPCDLGPS